MHDRKTWLGLLVAAAVGVSLLIIETSLGPAQANEPAAGNWRGTGQITTEAGGRARKARCRAEIVSHTASGRDPAKTLWINGRCAVASRQSTFALSVTIETSGVVSAVLKVPAFSDNARFRGYRRGEQINLESTSLFEQGGQRYRSRLVINFTDDSRFAITEWQRPEHAGEDQVSLSLEFARDHLQN